MADLLVTRDAFEEALNTAVQFLRDSGYEGALEDGTGIHDTVLKPNALLYVLFRQLVDRASAYLSLDQAQRLRNSISADDYDAAVDGILSNWFLSRNAGKPTYGLLRLWFLRPLDFLQFKRGDVIGTARSLTLVCSEDRVFDAFAFSAVVNTTNNISEYYVDIPVQSVVNTSERIVSGSSVSGQIADIYFVRMSIPGDFAPGVSKERSEDFIQRAKKAVTTREMITERAISTVLMEKYDEILRLYVAGYGALEQLRDVTTFRDISVHVGNKADIWVAAPVTTSRSEIKVGLDGVVDLAPVIGSGHMACLLDIECDETTVDYTLQVEETLWGCPCTVPSLVKTELDPEKIAVVSWLGCPALGAVSAFVRSADNRVSNYDPLIKGMHLVVLQFSLRVSRISNMQDNSVGIRNSIISYIDKLAKEGQSWVESEMLSRIHESNPNVRKIELPVFCRATLFDPRRSRMVSTQVNDSFLLSSLPADISTQITANTIQMYSSADRVSVTFV